MKNKQDDEDLFIAGHVRITWMRKIVEAHDSLLEEAKIAKLLIEDKQTRARAKVLADCLSKIVEFTIAIGKSEAMKKTARRWPRAGGAQAKAARR